jgi:tRNA A-37 threonylcarbamoyl transferase component Bud32
MDSASPRPEPIKPNAPIGESYVVVRMLRETRIGRVYLCKHSALTLNQFAVLVYFPEIANSGKDAARIAEVCQKFPQVIQPNVCRVYEAVAHEGVIALCMEYSDAATLNAYLADAAPSLRDALRLLYSVGEGLRAIHALGVVHGNVTVHSILLPESHEPTLTDPLVSTSDLLEDNGELKQLAPEQLSGEAPSEAADLFSLGAVAYQLLTKERIYAGITLEELQKHPLRLKPRPVGELRVDCPPEIAGVVMQLLSPLASNRPASVSVLLDAIREWELQSEVNLSVPESAPASPAATVTELPPRRYDADPAPTFQGRKLLTPPPTISGWALLGQRWRLLVGSTVFQRLVWLAVGTVAVGGLLLGLRAFRSARLPLSSDKETVTLEKIAEERGTSLRNRGSVRVAPSAKMTRPVADADIEPVSDDVTVTEVFEEPTVAPDQTSVRIIGVPSSLPAGPADPVTITVTVRNTGSHEARKVEVSVLTGSGRATPLDGPRTLKVGQTMEYSGRTRETMTEIESQRIAFVATCANCPNHGR